MDRSELVTVIVIVAVTVLLVAVGVIDHRRTKRRGGRSPVSGLVGTFDEVFHPEAARAAEIREVQQELPADAPTPGDPLFPGGKIIISVRRKD